MLIDRSFAEVFSSVPPATDCRRKVLPAPRPVEVSIAADDQLFTGVSFDVGPTALFVVTSRVVDEGTHVALQIDLPEGAVVARGTVTAIQPSRPGSAPGLTIRIDEITQADRAALETARQASAPDEVERSGTQRSA